MLLSKTQSLLFRGASVMGLLVALLALSEPVNASCSGIMGRTVTGHDTHTSSLGVGRINIVSSYLQPVGAVLATGVSNYNTIHSGGLANTPEERIILTCTQANDKAGLAWAFATNGDSIIGGFYEIPGYPGYYATQFPYVAIKLTFADTGEVFSRFWQKSSVAVQTEETNNGTGGFVIRKKHLPKIVATLIKWPDAYGKNKDSNGIDVTAHHCAGSSEKMIPTSQTANPNQTWSADHASVNGMARGCGQPNGYLNLLGTGGLTVKLGTDSNSSYHAWDYSIPVGLNGSPAATFSYTPSCVVRTATPYVVFPQITVSDLKSGQTIDKQFDVTLECDNMVNPNATPSSVSVGLQPSMSAFNHAKALGLLDASTNAVTHLVSDNYGASGMAEGVGITLKNAEGDRINFVGWEGCVPVSTGSASRCPTPSDLTRLRAAGWDPVMSGSTQISSNMAMATTTYRKTYTATLGRINNLEPTPGKIKATATVLVRLP